MTLQEDALDDKDQEIVIQTAKKEQNTFNTHRELYDPCFVDISISFPRFLEAFIKKVDKILFIYEITDSHLILVNDLESNTSLKSIYAAEYGSFDFTLSLDDLQTDLVFIFGAEDYRQQQAAEMKRKYKDAVKNREAINITDLYMEKRRSYFEYQVKNKVNFVFVESSEFLHRQLKSMVDIIRKQEVYVPKTKKFNRTDKQGYLKNLLMSVPGISDSVATCILNRYPNIDSLSTGLTNRNEFCNLTIYDGNVTRKMPVKVFEKLYKVIMSEDPFQIV